jgi:hypothetical protein
MIPLRRSAAALAVTVVLGAVAAPGASAAPTPSPAALPSGLYGKGDPTYDGVFRQSLALLALERAGVKPAAKAVDWLVGQQCDNGSFPAFRPDAATPCDAKTQPDTNMTAAAVQALGALGGQDAALKKAVGWLKSVQNKDGGWPSWPGSPSDANSTSIVIGALHTAGEKPADVKSKDGRSPLQTLLDFRADCGKPEDRGAFGFQPDKGGKLAANADATAAVVTAASGRGGFVIDVPKEKDRPVGSAPDCKEELTTPEAAASAGSAYLARTLESNGGHLKTPPMPGAGATDAPDFGNTADAVVALAADGHKDAAGKAADWLAKNSAKWARDSGPGAYAQLIFAAHATGADPASFGGADLVGQLTATGPAPQAQKAADDTEKETADEDGGSSATWWIVGVAFVASMGAGFLISGRNKKNQQL